MRLSDFFLLVFDLFQGGIQAVRTRLDVIAARNPEGRKAIQGDKWHVFAILAMIWINFSALVIVPRILDYVSQNQSQTVFSSNIYLSNPSEEIIIKEEADSPFAADNEKIYSKVEVEPIPINLHQVRNRFRLPEYLKGSGVSTNVTLKILVDKNGNYIRHTSRPHPFPTLRQAVEKEAASLIFLPALDNGQTVAHWTEVNFHFDF